MSELERLADKYDARGTECVKMGWYTAGDELFKVAAELRALAGAGGWRQIESAPRDGTPILATSTVHGAREVVCWQDTSWSDPEGWVNDGPIKDRFYANPAWFTHWQPLPSPPAVAG